VTNLCLSINSYTRPLRGRTSTATRLHWTLPCRLRFRRDVLLATYDQRHTHSAPKLMTPTRLSILFVTRTIHFRRILVSYRRYSARRWSLRCSRSFKVTDVGTNRKPGCDFLLAINTNSHVQSSKYKGLHSSAYVLGEITCKPV